MAEGDALKVAYLGPKGSFTHQAALQLFPLPTTHILHPHTDFPAIFTAVSTSAVHHGVIPIENSTNGFVVQILDLFAQPQYADVAVVGETFVGVTQSLLGHRRRDVGARQGEGEHAERHYKHIKTLYSHPQAWGQCVPFLTTHLRHAERVDTTSTSRAAEIVAADTSGEAAAICSPLAAELYGLDVLEPSIEERKGNTTRFLVLERRQQQQQQRPETPSPPPPSVSPTSNNAKYKSLLLFTIPHTQPSSLARALSVFGTHAINLTSLNSRPSSERKWRYIFFVEFWGRRGEGRVEEALGELGGVVEGWRWVGSWGSERGKGGEGEGDEG